MNYMWQILLKDVVIRLNNSHLDVVWNRKFFCCCCCYCWYSCDCYFRCYSNGFILTFICFGCAFCMKFTFIPDGTKLVCVIVKTGANQSPVTHFHQFVKYNRITYGYNKIYVYKLNVCTCSWWWWWWCYCWCIYVL